MQALYLCSLDEPHWHSVDMLFLLFYNNTVKQCIPTVCTSDFSCVQTSTGIICAM